MQLSSPDDWDAGLTGAREMKSVASSSPPVIDVGTMCRADNVP